MALPPYCGDDDPVVCCDNFYAVATSIKSVAYAALVDCAGEELCEPIFPFVSAAEPHLAVQDYLAVWFGAVEIPLPRGVPAQAKGLLIQQPVVTFNVKLVESGYPVIEQVSTTVDEPTSAEIDWASRHFLAHSEAVLRGVVDYLTAQNTCGTLKSYTGVRYAVSGGSARAQFSANLEVAWQA
jgi:hypothetical protein